MAFQVAVPFRLELVEVFPGSIQLCLSTQELTVAHSSRASRTHPFSRVRQRRVPHHSRSAQRSIVAGSRAHVGKADAAVDGLSHDGDHLGQHMTRRAISVTAIVVLVGGAFIAGYVLGRGERTTVPDLFGLDRRSPEATQSYVALKKFDLRLGRERFHLCGGKRSDGMVVRQYPAAGESVPVGSIVDVWRAMPVDSILNVGGTDRPCQHP
jgi:hypothetical protein